MADIARPVKRGDVRTFDESYNKGFKNIYASEIDAEFETLYGAWNFGAINVGDSSITSDKIVDGAITGSKIAFGAVDSNHILDGTITEADLSDPIADRLVPPHTAAEQLKIMTVAPDGTLIWVDAPPAALTPGQVQTQYIADAPNGVTDAKITSVAWSKVTGVPTTMPPSGPAGGDLVGTYPNPQLGPGSVGGPEIADASISDVKISDLAWAKITGAPTALPPSGNAGGDLSGPYPNPRVVAASGDFNVAGNEVVTGLLRNRTYTSGMTGGSAFPVGQGAAVAIPFENVWFNSMGAAGVAPNPGSGWIYTPNFYDMVLLWALVSIDRNNGFGCSIALQYSTDGVNWTSHSQESSTAALTYTSSSVLPAPPSTRWRILFTNATGYNPVTVAYRYLIMVSLGAW